MSDTEELTRDNFRNPYRYTRRNASAVALDSFAYGKKSTESLLRPATAFSSPAPRGRASTDALWKPGSSISQKQTGFKAMSTPFLGLFKDSEPSKPKRTKPMINKHNYRPEEYADTSAQVLEASNRRINGDAEYFVNSLKVAMMNLRFGESLPPEHNHAVNVLLELMDHTIRYEKDKDTEMEEVRLEAAGAIEMAKAESEAAIESSKAETEAAFAMAKKNVEAWRKLEEEYKKQVKRLEIKLAAGEGGMEAVALSRSKSRLREKRAGFQKTSSNLSAVVSSENNDNYCSKLSKYTKTSSNLSELLSWEKDEEGGLNRKKSAGATTTSSKRQSNQVFDHKRTSAVLQDKLFADFGTLMDSQLSQSIQHREDALAGAARQKWEDERRRCGHTGYTSSPESPEDMVADLSFEIYDPELVHDYRKHEVLSLPRVVLETATGGKKEVDIDEDDDDGGDDIEEIEGGRYQMKPKKGDGFGKRTKAFFGMNRKKSISLPPEELDWNYSTCSFETDDIGEDKHDSHNIADALFGMTSFATTIASPVPGIEQALGPKKAILQIPPIPVFRPKNKRSATNLFGLVPDYKTGVKEKYAVKVGKFERLQHSKAPIAHYELGDQPTLLLPEIWPYSEALRSSENIPPSMYSKRAKENELPSIVGNNFIGRISKQISPGGSTDHPDRKISIGALSIGQGVSRGSTEGPPKRYYGSVKRRGPSRKLLEARSISSLRNEYNTRHDAGGDGRIPTGGHFTSLAHSKNLSETLSAGSPRQNCNTSKGADDDDKTPTASYFTINRRHSYSDNEEDDNKSTYGKSNSCLTLDSQSGIISAASKTPDYGAMRSGIVVEQQEPTEACRNAWAALSSAPQHDGRFEQRAASGAYSRMLPRGPSIDRVFDPRLARKSSPVTIGNQAGYRESIMEKSSASRPHTVIPTSAKSSDELNIESAAAEYASHHVLWHAPGHKFAEKEPSRTKLRKLSDPFTTIEAVPIAHMKDPVSSSSPHTARVTPELPKSSRVQTVQTASIKCLEEVKEERHLAETTSRRTLCRASGHKFVDKEVRWARDQNLSDPFSVVDGAPKSHRNRPPDGAPPMAARGTAEQACPARTQATSTGSVQFPEELKEERASAEAASRRLLWRASGHTFADDERSLEKQRSFSDRFCLIKTPSEAHKNRQFSTPTPLTARKVPFSLQQHGDPICPPPRDDSLITARSARGARPELRCTRPPAENDTNGNRSEPYQESETMAPCCTRTVVLKTMAHRDQEFAKGPAADGYEDEEDKENQERYEQDECAFNTDQLVGGIKVNNNHTGRDSIFGSENLIQTLHAHPEPTFCRRKEGGAIIGLHASDATDSAFTTGGNRSDVNRSGVVDDRNAELRGASDSSEEEQHTPDTSSEAIFKGRKPIKASGDGSVTLPLPLPDSRPVTAIYQGPIGAYDHSLPLASGDTPHSSPQMITALHSRVPTPESSAIRGRTNESLTSDRTRNKASEPEEKRQSSEEQLPVLKRSTNVTKGTHERVSSTSSVSYHVQQRQGLSNSPLLVAKHRRDGSSQSRGGRRDESTSSIGSLRSPVNPVLNRVQKDLLDGSHGVSGQQRCAHMRNISGTVLKGDHRSTRFGGAGGNEQAKPLLKTAILSGAATFNASAPPKQLGGENKEEVSPAINLALAAARSVAQAADKKKLEEKQKEVERK